MKLHRHLLLASLMAAPLVHAQVWVKVAAESTTASVTLPAGATYRLGSGTSWSASTVVAHATTFDPLFFPSGEFPFADPAPGLEKELDIMERAASQVVLMTDSSTTPMTTATLSIPGTAPPSTISTAPGSAYIMTFSGMTIIPGSVDSLIFGTYTTVPASELIGTLLSGVQMNVTLGGVTMLCSFGQSFSNGTFNLSCVVAAPVASK
jgi:hypothetical protein